MLSYSSGSTNVSSSSAMLRDYPAIGYHTFRWLEWTNLNGNCFAETARGGVKNGMSGFIRG
jgi:hypothetical protein